MRTEPVNALTPCLSDGHFYIFTTVNRKRTEPVSGLTPCLSDGHFYVFTTVNRKRTESVSGLTPCLSDTIFTLPLVIPCCLTPIWCHFDSCLAIISTGNIFGLNYLNRGFIKGFPMTRAKEGTLSNKHNYVLASYI